MIPGGVEVYLAVGPIDLRWGFHRLSGFISEKIGRDVRSGALFLFIGKRRHALKVLFFDGTGICLFYKRLDEGLFRLPERAGDAGASVVEVSEGELNALLDGIDLDRPARRARQRAPRQKRIH